MIAYLSGRVLQQSDHSLIVLTAGGVGYDVQVLPSVLMSGRRDSDISLHIYSAIKEDSITLYGFETELERQVFAFLLRVSGVGARLALAALGTIAAADILGAISAGDAARLQQIPGVGRKLSEKIVFDLRERVGSAFAGQNHGSPTGLPQRPVYSSEFEDALQALTELGFRTDEAEAAARAALQAGATSSSEILREALRARGTST